MKGQILKSYYLEKEQNCNLEQLPSYWGLKNFQITGNYILSFLGQKKKPKQMKLFFIIENFDLSLQEIIFHKHLLLSIFQEHLDRLIFPSEPFDFSSLITSKILVQESSFFIIMEINLDSLDNLAKEIEMPDLNIEPNKFALDIMDIYKEKIKAIHSDYLELKKS
jgi:hypothetical protein